MLKGHDQIIKHPAIVMDYFQFKTFAGGKSSVNGSSDY
jgi:hypothetical protein